MPAHRRPEEIKVPWARRLMDLPKALRRGPRGFADLARAAVELARASRTVENRREPLPTFGQDQCAGGTLDRSQSAIVERVAYAIPVMARRVPWRADCLVQALAARRWLAREGIVSHIAIGGALEDDGDFLAHAWLRVGDRIVTGGEVTRYHEFVRPGAPA